MANIHYILEEFEREAKEFIKNPIEYVSKTETHYIGRPVFYITVSSGESGNYDVGLRYCPNDDTICVFGKFDIKMYKKEDISRMIHRLGLLGL